MSVIRQFICTVVVCYSCLSLTVMYTWQTTSIASFISVNTTLDRPMTDTESSLFMSLSSIGSLIATPLSGFLLDSLGRKYSCILFSLPQVIAWILLCFMNEVEVILTAMFISGFGSCVLIIVPVYVAELCQKSIRGRMTSGTMIFYGLGMVLAFILSGYLDYYTMIYTCLLLSAFGTTALFVMAESPTYLMKKGQEKSAKKAIAFFRGTKDDSLIVTEEIEVIKRSLNPLLDDGIPENEILSPDLKQGNKLPFWKFMKKSRSSRQALIVAFLVSSMVILQGLVIVQAYAEQIFTIAVPNMSSVLSCLLFAVTFTVSTVIAAYLVDALGRRPLMIYSSIFCCICLVLLGSQIQLQWGPHWLTAIFIHLFCVICTCGSGTVPYVIVAEIFLPEVRSIGSMLSMEWSWICNFVAMYTFNTIVTNWGLEAVFYIFACVCFLSAIASYLYIPETNALTVDVIQTLLIKKPYRS